MNERQKTLDNKVILTDTQKKKLLEFIDKTKNSACQNYGWHITLYDKEDRQSGYPFIHLKLYWQIEQNEEVVRKVNEYIKEYSDATFEYGDLAIFCNGIESDLHNAFCDLTEDSTITEWLLENGIGQVWIDYSEDRETLTKAGLSKYMVKDGYSNIGKISTKPHKEILIQITDKGKPTGKYFVPETIYQIDANKFEEWLYNQDRFEILEEDAFEGDFGYLIETCDKIISDYRQNPEKFVETFPFLKKVLGV